MIVLETERLVLRWFDIKDAPFILELVNDPAWIQFIGDKRIKNLDDAKKYILNGPVDMYNKMGFGLYLVERKEDFTPLGMCGLIKRDSLEDVDIGFAFLEKFRSKGYGFESASAVIDYGVQNLGMKRIVAIT
ncbi:N-acetyltransferase, partial [Klebsiella pneumoniae]|nr:N-acetyltransferase [Klebsiella pneumoniae]